MRGIAGLAVAVLVASCAAARPPGQPPPPARPSPAELSAFLEEPAREAVRRRDYALAVSLYRGILEIRGEGDEAAWHLAEVFQFAREPDAAVEVLERYAAVVRDAAARRRALDRITTLRKTDYRFGSGRFAPRPALRQAVAAFKKGRALFRQELYAEAALLFRAGIVMAPNMPGSYRELAEAYGRLGRAAEADAFFAEYLRLHPFGQNADAVRAQLADTGLLGSVTIASSFPCEQVWLNGQPVPLERHPPGSRITLSPGRYKALCYVERYHHVQFERFGIVAGGATKVEFAYAILLNELDPWGRITIEDPRRRGVLVDIGLFPELGVAVPPDGRDLQLVLVSGDHSHREQRTIRVTPGARLIVRWTGQP